MDEIRALLISATAALLPIAACYLARWSLDRGRLEPPWIFPGLSLLGGAGGLFFALYASPRVARGFDALLGGLPAPLFYDAVAAPTLEELGKAFVLLPFVLTRWFRSGVDGLLYGFAAGAGFAVVENYLYFAAAYGVGGEMGLAASMLGRLLPSILIHGGCTALFGAYLGAVRWDPRPLVIGFAPFAGFSMAVLVHGLWNALQVLGAAQQGVLFERLGYGLLTALALALLGVLHLARRLELQAIAVRLVPEVAAGRLSEAELKAIVTSGSWRRAELPAGVDRDRLRRAAISLAFALHQPPGRRAQLELRLAHEDLKRARESDD